MPEAISADSRRSFHPFSKLFSSDLLLARLELAKLFFMDEKDLAKQVIAGLGGTSAAARLCEIKPPSVSVWQKNGIPLPWRKYLQLLRPDLFKLPKGD